MVQGSLNARAHFETHANTSQYFIKIIYKYPYLSGGVGDSSHVQQKQNDTLPTHTKQPTHPPTSSKAFRRLDSDSPAILDMISGPLIKKKNAPVSFATALAIKVFPDPGGPYSSTPRGGLTPRFLNRVGWRSGSSIISRICGELKGSVCATRGKR